MKTLVDRDLLINCRAFISDERILEHENHKERDGVVRDPQAIEHISRLDRMITGLNESIVSTNETPSVKPLPKFLETWALLDSNGSISHRDHMGISAIYGFGLSEIEDMLDDVLGYMEEDTFTAPKSSAVAWFKMTNIHHEEGQMTFPETGQWDFPAHWEMDCEVVRFDSKDGETSNVDQVKE